MNLKSLTRKVAAGDFEFALGRFYLVRRLYSRVRALRDPAVTHGKSDLWPDFDVLRGALHLGNNSYATGFNLPTPLVEEIRDFASSRNDWFRPGHPEKFKLSEVSSGKVHGRPIAVAFSDGAERCPAVKRIVEDPALLATAGRHLGYKPRMRIARFYWSPVSELSTAERRELNQTVEFHYDVDALGFCYAHFYLNDVDEGGGPHVLVPGTHKRKPLRFLLGSVRTSEARVRQEWGHSDLTLTGGSGTGFLEDTSCMHRAKAPETSDRLMLQVRFN